MKTRIVSLLLSICLSLTPALAAGVTSSPLKSSGLASLPKLSKEEITQQLAKAPLGFTGGAFVTVPSTSAPYAAGEVSEAPLAAAMARLNLFRRLAGLMDVDISPALTTRAQYGAVLLAANGTLSHHPDKPAGMDEDFYQRGLNAASSCNIYMGTNATLPQAVDAFMDDSDSGNLPSLGHRRWLLNPTMGVTGLGFSPSGKTLGGNTYNFATLWAFDRSGLERDYDFIAWPASGAFPSSLFDKDQAWSVTLDPEKYAVPALEDLQITITRASDGMAWTLRGEQDYTAANSGSYLGVDTANYGVDNCVIFRPVPEAAPYNGIYTVNITGLKTSAGQSADLSYEVDFFSPNTTSSPAKPSPSTVSADTGFSDVQNGAWYAEDVAYAARNGLFNGVGGDRFDPDGSMTRVMLMTVLARLDGANTTPSGQETWFIKGHRWAVTNRISDGLEPHRALTLEELSSMLYNYAKLRRNASAAHNYHLGGMPDGNAVSSWAAEGVNWMVDQGLLHGDENGRLNPQRTATRAQVAALLHRFLETEQ